MSVCKFMSSGRQISTIFSFLVKFCKTFLEAVQKARNIKSEMHLCIFWYSCLLGSSEQLNGHIYHSG